MFESPTAFHRGGSGPSLVCLHGLLDTWRTWELVLSALERQHEVLAPTLPGHHGGPPFLPAEGMGGVVDAVERAMDAAGMATAHLVGNSLGGWLALQLAARGRARSVVALAPAGGWDPGFFAPLAARQAELQVGARRAALAVDQLVATPGGRRAMTASTTVAFEHIPPELLAHQLRGLAACDAGPMLEIALREGYELDAASVTCPVRIVWGTHDALLPLPEAAVRFRRDWLPTADWIELDDVGHAPQLDVPAVTAALVLEVTSGPCGV